MKPLPTIVPGRGFARARTPAELLAGLGRITLWLAVAVVLVRGLAALVASDRAAPGPPANHSLAFGWPDDAARAFAVQFATAYLGTRAPTTRPSRRGRSRRSARRHSATRWRPNSRRANPGRACAPRSSPASAGARSRPR